MKSQKIIINKKTGSIKTVYSDGIENILNNFTDLTVERVSKINFNNETKVWEAHELSGELIDSSKSKIEIYNNESRWADENLQSLSKKYFDENITD